MGSVFYRTSIRAAAAGLAIALTAGAAFAHGSHGGVHRNGVGADPDGDSNPATDTRLETKIGDAAEAAFDPPYKVITFEAPPGKHNDPIRDQYKGEHNGVDYGVTFSRGLHRQVCEGQRYFQYDSQCTYLRAPSGAFAAVYEDELNRPLRIRFENPVCASALAIYPAGGEEGEEFELTLQPYAEGDRKLKKAKARFYWTNDTFRWRHMASAYFLETPARRIDVSMRSLKEGARYKPVRFLIDDLAFIENKTSGDSASTCEEILKKIDADAESAGRTVSNYQYDYSEEDLFAAEKAAENEEDEETEYEDE